MSYQDFAYLYDALMQDAPYEEWLKFLEEINVKYQHKAKKVLDVGCGTGAIAIPLAQKGLDVIGIDLSEDMLAVAQNKSAELGMNIQWLQQDMTQLELTLPVDTILCLCDSINYVLEDSEVQKTFQGFFDYLIEDGLLLFDTHSIYKMEHIFAEQTYGSSDEELSYLWQCHYDEETKIVEHELSFFVQHEDGLYQRYDELHQQKALPIERYIELLERVGFTVLQVSADFTHEQPGAMSERIFFVARKNGIEKV